MFPSTTGAFADPKIIVSHFHLHEGDVVADFGAGSGHYMKLLSDAVGSSGKVYLCEIQKNLVEALGIKKNELHLANVSPLWGDVEAEGGTKIFDGALDAGLLSNVFFQFENKARALKEVKRTLKRGRRLIVIDWSDSFDNLGPRTEDVVTEDDAKNFLTQAGFTFERTFPVGDHHYGLVFRNS